MFSFIYLALISQTNEGTARAIWLPIVGWIGLISILCLTTSFAMFTWFIGSSKIAEAVTYYEIQTTSRFITAEEYKSLYPGLRKISGSIPLFRLTSVRDPEAMQYGIRILKVLREAGIKTRNDSDPESLPTPVDAYSTDLRGLYVYAKQNPEAQSVAALLRDTFKDANIEMRIGLEKDNEQDAINLLIGYR